MIVLRPCMFASPPLRLEHTFRLVKQTLGWTVPKLRDPEAADRWTWLILIAHTQLRLARPLAVDLRRPWEKPVPPNILTPARVRRGFRNIRAKIARLSHSCRSQAVKSCGCPLPRPVRAQEPHRYGLQLHPV